MEAIGADVITDRCGSRNAAFGLDGDGETDGEDSYFDLVFESPDRPSVRGGGDAEKKESRFTGSPRDVFLSRNRLSDSKALSPATLLRSKPKFKVLFTFSFRKTPKYERNLSTGGSSSKSAKIDESKRFPVEETAAASIMAGDNSLRSQLLRESSDSETSPEKISSRDAAVPKYLKLIKPLYHKVWKRQSEKAKVADSLTPSSPPATGHVNSSPMKLTESTRAGNFKIAGKRLGKSRSASAAVGVPDPAAARRRDDSLLQQHDGIQGAVLYCKRSYNSSSKEFSQLFRTSSDPSHEKQGQQGRHSCQVPIR
ncbi:hypothetical protein CASFOL_006930 [Castilleja foliolosa]|uniref:Membrane-associated kinase regulator 2 n=1 Tax=Castilleja foliolosa TaxID=1961234 RepID=A0ABD3E9T8_9LAMI